MSVGEFIVAAWTNTPPWVIGLAIVVVIVAAALITASLWNTSPERVHDPLARPTAPARPPRRRRTDRPLRRPDREPPAMPPAHPLDPAKPATYADLQAELRGGQVRSVEVLVPAQPDPYVEALRLECAGYAEELNLSVEGCNGWPFSALMAFKLAVRRIQSLQQEGT